MGFLGLVCLLASSLTFVQPASAQIATGGAIRGHVKDEHDSVLQGVRITATSPDAPNAFEVTSDESGYYRLLDLPQGEYTLSAVLEGFVRWARDGLPVRPGLNITVPIVMQTGMLAGQAHARFEPDRRKECVDVISALPPNVIISRPAPAFRFDAGLILLLPGF